MTHRNANPRHGIHAALTLSAVGVALFAGLGFAADVDGSTGPILAQLEKMEECRYGSGGWAERYGHHTCKIFYTLTNVTDREIVFDSGGYVADEAYDGAGGNTGRIGYTHDLGPGATMRLENRCVIPHEMDSGGLVLKGTGHFAGESTQHTINWHLAMTCP